MCERCDHIRHTADLIAGISLINWPERDVLQLLAYVYAQIKRHAIDENDVEAFEDYWKALVERELKQINHANPIEPKKFDEKFDFRSMIHK